MTRTVIISTVGTSLFNNYMKFRSDNEELNLKSIKDDFDFLEKADADKLKNNRQCEEKANTIRKKLVPNAFDYLKEKASAEIASITKFVSEKNLKKEDVLLYFIISDTAHSLLAAQIISEHLKEEGFAIDSKKQLKVIRALSVQNGEDFENRGLPNLAEEISNIKKYESKVATDNKEKVEIYINITGGYKGVLPYASLIAQMYEIPVFYIYENSEDLIYLPQMPLAFDPLLAEEYYYWLKERDLKGNIDNDVLEELKGYGFVKKNHEGKLERSGMGTVFCDWVFSQAPESPRTIGKLIEYKLLEVFYNNVMLDGKTINNVLHSDEKLLAMPKDYQGPDPKKKPKGREIDILLDYSDGSKEIMEIKPFQKFLIDSDSDVKNQFIQRIIRVQNYMKNRDVKNVTLTFILYGSVKFNEIKHNPKYIDLVNKKISEYRGIAQGSKLKFKYVRIDMRQKDAYSKFLDNELILEDIKDL